MLFSFLIPVYNVEAYLAACMESLLVQKGAPFEIVLLDDGSTDGSGKICDDYAHRYPDLIRVVHKQNEGLLMTRRRGFKEAKGDWFICVDSDDYVSKKLLETVVDTIRRYDCDMVMYNFAYTDDQGKKTPSRLDFPELKVFDRHNKKKLYSRRLLTTDINNMWIRAFSRKILDIDCDYSDCGIRNMSEDAIQVLPLYTNSEKTVYVNKVLYYYRRNGSSITANINNEKWQSIITSYCMTTEYLAIWNVSKTTEQKFYTLFMENIANYTRWLFANNTLSDILKEGYLVNLKDNACTLCESGFRRQYTSTRYNRICVPIISKLLINKRYSMLNIFFKLERMLLK